MAIWGGTFVAGKIVAQNLTPFMGAFLRFSIASLVLWLSLKLQKNKLEKLNLNQILFAIALGLSGVLAYNVFFFLGLRDITASRAGLIIALNPVAIAIGTRILWQEKLTPLKIIGIVISLMGAMLVITEGNLVGVILRGIGRGELYILGCVLSWVTYSLVGKLAMQQLSALTTTSYAIWIGTLFLFPLAIWEQKNRLPEINWLTVFSLVYLGVLGTVVAFNWYYDGIKILGAAKAAIFINLVPIFATVFSFIFLKERFTSTLFIGGMLVILGVSLVNRRTS